MPGFIADASAALPWCFVEEATPWTEALLDRLRGGEEIVVPAHWPIEVMNGLVMAVRRSRIDLDRVIRFASDLSWLAIRIQPPYAPAVWNTLIQVATKHRLTMYDAAYLELALRTGLPVATLDGDLQKAAHAEHVALLGAAS
jgi:predicted nucleic acid-binding protein